MTYAICLDNESYEGDLTRFMVYRIIEDKKSESRGFMRIVDNTGEDYAYESGRFERLTLAAPQEARMNAALQASHMKAARSSASDTH
jgi:hypothetical protein